MPLPSSGVDTDMPIDGHAPAAARAAIRALEPFMDGEGFDRLLIAVTELVTNAYVHGPRDGRVRVRAGIEDDLVALRVSSPRGDRLPAIDRREEGRGGLGLLLVEQVSCCWGVEEGDGEVTVWAQLPRSVSESGSPA